MKSGQDLFGDAETTERTKKELDALLTGGIPRQPVSSGCDRKVLPIGEERLA
jgi:hypothetical protein